MSYESKTHQCHLKFGRFCTITYLTKPIFWSGDVLIFLPVILIFPPKMWRLIFEQLIRHFNKTRTDVWAGTDVTKQPWANKLTHQVLERLFFPLSLKFSSFFSLISPYSIIFKDRNYSADSRDPRSRRTVVIRNTCLQRPRCNFLSCVQGHLGKLHFWLINRHFYLFCGDKHA